MFRLFRWFAWIIAEFLCFHVILLGRPLKLPLMIININIVQPCVSIQERHDYNRY